MIHLLLFMKMLDTILPMMSLVAHTHSYGNSSL
jgi:hypothetical protein